MQIAPLRDKSRDGLTLRVVRQKRIDLIELIGCHELQYLGADVAARSSGQCCADVQVRRRRNIRKPARYEVAQAALGDVRSCLDKGVEIVSGTAIIELHDRRIAHLRMLFQARGDAGTVVGKLRAAAFAIVHTRRRGA